ncbi:MAG TPA: PIG-L deacetylase family protein [Devosiaceae bacterium]|jgi:LmbE family N-acetylglucosaminyl deacetylase|nr:PIG-L deacetylase family protein [Devosiaceae bacterium]
MRLLALGAHPDDIEIFMFGLVAACAGRGDELSYAIATDGARGGKGDAAELARTRRQEAIDAAALLGVVPRFLDFPDGNLLADAALISALREVIAEVRPDLVVTHAPNDYHGDHRALSDAARIATSFQAPLLLADTLGGVGFVPTHYVDITVQFPRKEAAVRAHRSQDPERFVLATRTLNGFRAGQANAGSEAYAEAYRFEPVFPFVDIRDLLPPAPPVRPVADRRRRD